MLIQCPECQSNVSDTAPHCPHCGAPVAARTTKDARAIGESLNTVQLTSKRLKLHSLLSAMTVIFGVIWSVAATQEQNPQPSSLAGLLILGGLVWFIITRFRIWWHHR